MGFVAGTLVHTKDGLRPIESLQVGDFVLAKDESGQGDTAYKRVLKTLRFEDKEIWYLEFGWMRTSDKPQPDVWKGFLTCTRNHPFWVLGRCIYVNGFEQAVFDEHTPHDVWPRADLLEPGMVLELANGDLVEVTKSLYLAQTEHEHVGFIQGNGAPESWQDELDGRLVEFGSAGPSTDLQRKPPLVYNKALEDKGDEFEFPVYRTTVYNIEVEDFHTYYVGEMGVWVQGEVVSQ
ncbi:polymorphic toxin-type HINT domain-containing protein [Chitinibacter sp. GC72]|uniref:polymorphic toxin-type HINT domain-containing protein n=1 Tax=Chitinibacter sp. GC72 TaxID=1526917 RepID=UPI0012FB5715|nr:polymorphic toxin-type HINT domain-containing protein [Chitinibacter sp. GC72]